MLVPKKILSGSFSARTCQFTLVTSATALKRVTINKTGVFTSLPPLSCPLHHLCHHHRHHHLLSRPLFCPLFSLHHPPLSSWRFPPHSMLSILPRNYQPRLYHQ